MMKTNSPLIRAYVGERNSQVMLPRNRALIAVAIKAFLNDR
jgi:hypothetical protein